MPANQTFDEVEILEHVLIVSIELKKYHFRLFWKDSLIMNQFFYDLEEGLKDLQNAFFGLEFDAYNCKDRETARNEFFRVIRTRWRWLHK